MIKHIMPCINQHEWCEHCHRECKGVLRAYWVYSDNPDMEAMTLCNACFDIAMNETGILPEEF